MAAHSLGMDSITALRQKCLGCLLLRKEAGSPTGSPLQVACALFGPSAACQTTGASATA
jgi:hypothetical protein